MGYACSAAQGYIYIRGEYPLAEARLARHRPGPGARLPRPRRDGRGLRVRHRAAARRRRVHRGRGDRADQLARGQARRAEEQAAVPGRSPACSASRPRSTTSRRCCRSSSCCGSAGPRSPSTGTEASTGTRLFCLSGCVQSPGLYEYEFGVTLGDVIDGAGGVRDGRPLQAVLLGGAAGVFVGPSALDMPLTFEGVRAAGATLGSGVVLVLDDTVDVLPLLRRITRFFRDESCGQCVPCRVGTVRQEELVARLLSGDRRSAASRPSSRCSTRSAWSPATRRSAGSARRRCRPSSRPSN